MKITLPHKKHPIPKNAKRFDPHRFWIGILTGVILALTLELAYFSYFFLHATKVLDAPALPTIETNELIISRMEKELGTIERTVQTRTGSASQNASPVVE